MGVRRKNRTITRKNTYLSIHYPHYPFNILTSKKISLLLHTTMGQKIFLTFLYFLGVMGVRRLINRAITRKLGVRLGVRRKSAEW